MPRDSFVFHTEYRKYIRMLEPEHQLAVYDALIDYAERGAVNPDLPLAALTVFTFIKDRMEVEFARYEETKKKRAKAGQKGGRPSNEEKTVESNEKQKKAKKANAFSEKQNNPVSVFDSVIVNDFKRETHKEKVDFPPTAEDVKEFCESAGLDNVDPAFFVNFYAARGWMMGRSKMQDWKSAVLSWSHDAEKGRTKARGPTKFSNFKARDADFDKIAMDILRQQEKEAENEYSDSDGQINA